MLEIFKKVDVNIPLIEALKNMPQYAKFLKHILSKKGKYEDHEMVAHPAEVSSVVQPKVAIMPKDPGSVTIPCVFGRTENVEALCDLGSKINLMPLSI